MIKYALFFTLFIFSFIKSASGQFITTWKTDNPGTSTDFQITLPTRGTSYNYTVDWGDGTSNTGVTADITHTYLTKGIYTIAISGNYPLIKINYGDEEKLLTVEQWGNNSWTSMRYAFYKCSNLTIPATDSPDLALVTDMTGMFKDASSFNQPIDSWDVSNVSYMNTMFDGASSFNQPIGNWNVSSVLNMERMFKNASSFNQPIVNWVVSNVTNMENMFLGASSFNQLIDSWDVSSVINMKGMFQGCYLFNKPIDSWNITNVSNMEAMFKYANSFNQPIDGWNVSSVINMAEMFEYASSFNQLIGIWDVSNVTNMNRMFFATSSFNQSVNNWNVESVIDMSSMFGLATSYNKPMSNWNTRNVTDMNNMFWRASSFNESINNWNVSFVSNMEQMFLEATAFNQPINYWNTSNVTNMRVMFYRASSFNQPIDNWDVSNVTDMGGMFLVAIAFNQPIDNWDVSNVTDMNTMFWGASSFNQPIDNWDVGSITSMRNMFDGASSFNQNIGSWKINNVLDMTDMLSGTNLSVINYDKILIDWASLPNLQPNVTFGTQGLTYCLGANARQILIDTYNWSIGTDMQECNLEAINRSGAINFVINTDAYIGLGINGTSFYNDFFKMNEITGEIQALANFPGVARKNAVVFTINDIAYVGTGLDENGNVLNDFYAYDASTNQWTAIAGLDISNARSSAVAFAINGNGYVGTGNGATSELNDFWKYDPALNTWTELNGFTGNKRKSAVAFVIDNKAYVSGGFLIEGFSLQQMTDVQEFDPATAVWTEKVFADINLGFQTATAFVLKNQAFIAYGNQPYITRYDPLTNTIENLGDTLNIDDGTLGYTRANPISFVLADTAYFGFGSSGFTTTTYYADLQNFYFTNTPPTEIMLSANEIVENKPVGTVIGSFTSTDLYDDGTHTYSLVVGDGLNDSDNSIFSITGADLVSSEIFNYESKSELFLYIRTTDEYGAFYEKPFTVNVTDINETPIIEDQSFTINENTENSTVVGLILATDEENSPLEFSILTGNDTNTFSIDGAALIINDSSLLDFESTASFKLEVMVSEGALSDTANIVIDVININESPITQNFSFTLDESSPIGTVVGSVTASDPDGDELTFSIESGNTSDAFSIDPNGEITVNNSAAISFKLNPTFNLIINANDSGLSSSLETEIVLNQVLGIDNFKELTFYPNPAKNRLFINYGSSQKELYSVEIINTTGSIVISETRSGEINISSLKAGFYLLRVKNEGLYKVYKFLKK